jgi:hypothetical protein
MNAMKHGFARLLPAVLLTALIPTGQVFAHGGGAVMDGSGSKASFTGLVRITCFDDGAGPASYLMARVRDKSPVQAGLLVNLQLLKGVRAVSVTDPVSGNADYSPYAVLAGGNGVYTMLLNKTMAGARSFDLEWHCMTAINDHTGTEIIVDQFE